MLKNWEKLQKSVPTFVHIKLGQMSDPLSLVKFKLWNPKKLSSCHVQRHGFHTEWDLEYATPPLLSCSVVLIEVQKHGPEGWSGEKDFQIVPESNCSLGLNSPKVLPTEDSAKMNYLPLSSNVVTAISQRSLLRNKYYSAE